MKLKLVTSPERTAGFDLVDVETGKSLENIVSIKINSDHNTPAMATIKVYLCNDEGNKYATQGSMLMDWGVK